MKVISRKNKAVLTGFLLVTSMALAKTATDKKVERDNSVVNVRGSKVLTADEQVYGSTRDVEITRLIRREIINHKEFSTYARNIKIITLGGKVFLRGPVKSQTEKDQIFAYATKVAGTENVKNELEITR